LTSEQLERVRQLEQRIFEKTLQKVKERDIYLNRLRSSKSEERPKKPLYDQLKDQEDFKEKIESPSDIKKELMVRCNSQGQLGIEQLLFNRCFKFNLF